MSNKKSWLSVFTLMCMMVGATDALVALASSIVVPVRTTRPVSRLWYRGDGKDNDNDLSSSSTSSWTLEEDWAILDQLDKFTVGEGDCARTFWIQLATSTPVLSSKTPQALWQRCQQLINLPNDHHHHGHHHYNRTFGPSPPLLSNWRLEGNRAVGTLEDGRVVWMQYHLIGRLPGDLFSDATSPSLMALIPGGYLEAFGGRIYELGQPARDVTMQKTPVTSWSSRSASHVYNNNNIWQEDEQVEAKSEEHAHTTMMAWWLPATTGTISALLASTILSACIGYGAGLGIIADESGPHHQPLEQTRREHYQQVHYKLSPSSSYSTPSTLEQRKADLARRIDVEETIRRSLFQQLHDDKVLQQEQAHHPWSSSVPIGNRMEIEGGMLQSITESLLKDRAELQGLERLQFYEQQARAENLLP